MAIAEHEVTTQLNIRLSREQQRTLELAAKATGQTPGEFAEAAVLHATEDAFAPPRPATLSDGSDPLDKIFGIFKDEPLMDDLMERVRADRRTEIAIIEKAIEEEAKEAGAKG